MKKRIAIFISGRGSNMERIIQNTVEGILKDCCEIAIVLSNNKNAQGLLNAEKQGIKTHCIESKGKKREEFDKEIINFLENINPDYIILAGYMRIISNPLIDKYKNKIINIHPADTKLYQGMHGYEWAFKNKRKNTKITVHIVDEGVDTGKIIAQKKVNLEGLKTLEEIKKKGLEVEHEFYSEILYKIFSGIIKL